LGAADAWPEQEPRRAPTMSNEAFARVNIDALLAAPSAVRVVVNT
jgi:hypothetical protein